jgi:ABC-type nitrate/sulfonate/bicarbonate transport system substrate-binding protein
MTLNWRGASNVFVLCLAFTGCGLPSGNPRPAESSLLLAPSTVAKPNGVADKIIFVAGYKAQANVSFVGPYVAQEKGFYREQSLDVEIKHVARTGDNFKLLAATEADVTTGVGEDVIRLVQAGARVAAIASVTQRGDHGFASLTSSGIKHPKQWEGKTVGYKGAGVAIDYLALLNKLGVDRAKIQEVQIGYDPRVLADKLVDVLPVFLSNEPDIIRTQFGSDVNVIDPADYGVVLLGQAWLINPGQLPAKGSVYTRWLKATLRGLDDAFNHPNEAVDAVMKYAPEENRAHQASMLSVETKNSKTELTGKYGLGWMAAEPWSATQDALLQTGQIKAKLDVNAYFNSELLRAVRQNADSSAP